MSKEYKLIKEYPGSPKKGSIVKYYADRDVYNTKGRNACWELYPEVVESAPEYWEEVKEFQILSYWFNDTFVMCVGGNDDIDSFKRGAPKAGAIIKSIKRNSDGKVFTCGDLCNPISASNNRCKILGFEFIQCGRLRIRSSNFYMNLEGVEHSIDESSFQKIQEIKEEANLKLKEAQKLLDEVKAKINKL